MDDCVYFLLILKNCVFNIFCCEYDKQLSQRMYRHIIRLMLSYLSSNPHQRSWNSHCTNAAIFYPSISSRIFWTWSRSSALSFKCFALEDTFIRYQCREISGKCRRLSTNQRALTEEVYKKKRSEITNIFDIYHICDNHLQKS